MALLVELSNYRTQQEKYQKQNCLTADRVESIVINLKKSLCLGGTQTIRLEKEQMFNRIQLTFTAKVNNDSEILYCFWINKSVNIKSCVTLFQKNSYLRARSSEIIKNICKTAAFINTTNKNSNIFLIVNPHTYQIQFLNSIYLGCDQPKEKLASNLKILISQCLLFAKNFSSLLLYKANIISKYSLLMNCSDQMRPFFNGKEGQFVNVGTIRQELSISNCKISSSLKQAKNQKYQKNYNENINRVIEVYNNRVYQHDIILFSQISFFKKAKKFNQGAEDFNELILNYKPKSCVNFDNNFIFSTIFIQQSDKLNNKQQCIAQSAKAKLICFRAKIKYGLTSLNNDFHNSNSSSEEQFTQQQTSQNYLGPAMSKAIDKPLVAKVPNNGLPVQFEKRVYDMIKYEKTVLRYLRGAECVYLPKYYQTSQKNNRFRDCLLLDYLPGSTLANLILKKNSGLSLIWKLHFLMHLANAIRFLQAYDIVHLDLSVNNIMLTSQGLPKIIDFGQAYHQQALQRMFKQKKMNTKGHIPGRTFPFAPPETSQRNWKFSSKQDIYSFGIIAFRLIMGYFPNSCSDRKIQQFYMNRNVSESIYFSPEGVQWLGQYQIMISCLQLIINCMHDSQKMRPNPSWTHIIFRKMYQVAENFS